MLNKRDFLNRLQEQLSDLTSEERREALDYYEEYFADAGEENEADVLLTLGSPEQAAERIKAGLLKADEGMFTESGYREKIESDNPPEVYGKKEEKEKDRAKKEQAGQDAGAYNGGGQNAGGYSNGGQNAGGYNNSGYNNSGQNDGGYNAGGCNDGWQNSGGYNNGWQNGSQNAGGYYGGGYNSSGYNGGGYTYADGQNGKRKEGMSGGMIALIVVLVILASPLILGLGTGLLGLVIGVVGGIFGIIIAMIALLIGLFAAGAGLFVAGFPMLFVNPVGGILCIAAGCLIIALFLALFLLFWWFCGKFFPWFIREMENLGRYVSRKWDERKRRGERI